MIEEADKLTHNVLNLIKQTEKIKEEPLTKGNKMTKKLKIRFAKFENALAMQILEQEGSFRDSEHVGTGFPELCRNRIYLCDEDLRGNLNIFMGYFDTNAGRDEYLNKVIKWISEEQFPTRGELEIGKECEVSDGGEGWVRRIFAGKTAKQFGEPRTIALGFENSLILRRWKYVRPIDSCLQPKIDGDIYTWEEK